MSRLRDAYDALIAGRSAGARSPDDVLAAARADAAGPPARRPLLLAAAAVILVAGIAGALAWTGGGDDDATTVVASDPSSAPTTDGPSPDPVAVEVYFTPAGSSDCAEVAPITAQIFSEDPLTGAMETLLGGPPDEGADAALQSWFSIETEGMLQSTYVEEGIALISFDPSLPSTIPNASTSCGSMGLLAQLDATATQFDHVDRAVYALDGDVEAFYAWLQMTVPDDLPDWIREAPLSPDPELPEVPADDGERGHVIASTEGVEVRPGDGDDTLIITNGATAAFAVGEQVVFQAIPRPVTSTETDGPVAVSVVTVDSDPKTLPTGAGASRITLLDAGLVDGRPTALLAERSGGASPDDTFEELVAIDLETLERTVVTRQPSWESSTVEGRLLPDGDVIGLVVSEAYWSLARFTPGADDAVWWTEVSMDRTAHLAVQGSVATTTISTWDGGATQLEVTRHDIISGEATSSKTVAVVTDEVIVDDPLTCIDWYDATRLSCSRGDAPPLAVEATTGKWADILAPRGALVTTVR